MAGSFNVNGSNNTVIWAAEPVTRGTFTLLSTCIITLSLCVWSSIHLNLPGNDQNWFGKFFRRLAWIAGALVAPEYLILTAWTQRRTAQQLSKEAEEAFKPKQQAAAGDTERQLFSRQHRWTMTHSFWAIMGGISVDPNSSEQFIPNSQRSTLTANGVSLLFKHEPQMVPDISEEEVKDKSKGSSFTKLIACIQAAWFCLSCVARLSQRLPISMLELNTFAHALCTLIVYVLWWRKPLDIEQPLVLREDHLRPLLAYMWMASKTSCIPKLENRNMTVGRDPEFEAIIDENAEQKASSSSSSTGAFDWTSLPPFTVTTSQALPGTGFKVNGQSTRWVVRITHDDGKGEFTKVWTEVHQNPAVFNLTGCDLRRWKLAKKAMEKYQLHKPGENLNLVTIKTVPESMDYPNSPYEWSSTWQPLGLSVVVAGYGGLHALTWNAQFPSHNEMILWRVSALLIASPALLIVVLLLLMLLCYAAVVARSSFRSCYLRLASARKPQRTAPNGPVITEGTSPESPTGAKENAEPILRSFEDIVQKGVAKAPSTMWILGLFGKFALGLAVGSFITVYFLARSYLIYESVRTVFFLPPEAYIATRWTQYLPHVT
ncbi:hypothetical protein MMC13_006768 [Lambiella insularis]|nr:hypothetical protein [Lambiella insularis]